MAEASTSEIVSSFIADTYAQATGVPPLVVVPEPVEDADVLEEFLSERRASKVEIRVPERGDKRRMLELAQRNAELALRHDALVAETTRARRAQALEELREGLDLEALPLRIECFDVSNLGESNIVASMVVFEEAVPRKSDYRKFGIKEGAGQDDFRSMAEAVRRRFARLKLVEEEGYDRSFSTAPNLVVIDGGKGQLAAALEAMAEFELPRVAVVEPGQTRGGGLRPGSLRADPAAPRLGGPAAPAADPRRGPPFCRRLPPPAAGQGPVRLAARPPARRGREAPPGPDRALRRHRAPVGCVARRARGRPGRPGQGRADALRAPPPDGRPRSRLTAGRRPAALVSRCASGDDQMSRRAPRIVCLGGGTGLATLLRGLKGHTAELTAIVTLTDDGGSSGRLRRELEMPPPGDIRNCLVALAEDESFMGRLFQHRFTQGRAGGHSFGNLFLAALTEVAGSFDAAVTESGRVLAIEGAVVPATTHPAALEAEMEDGRIVAGETAVAADRHGVRRLFLSPGRGHRRTRSDPGRRRAGRPDRHGPGLALHLDGAAAARARPCAAPSPPPARAACTSATSSSSPARPSGTPPRTTSSACTSTSGRTAWTSSSCRRTRLVTDLVPVEFDRVRLASLGVEVVAARIVDADGHHHDPAALGRALVRLAGQPADRRVLR